MTQRDEWIVYQITDTNFPAGNLGNSSGLESALAHGKVERETRDLSLTFQYLFWSRMCI